MNLSILDAQTLGEDLSLAAFSQFGTVQIYDATTPEQVVSHGANSEVLLLNKVRLTAELLEKLPKLRLICVAATGFDSVDIGYCREHGIAVTNVPGYSAASVAQVTVGTVLSLATHLQEYCDFVKQGRYTAEGKANCLTPIYHELAGKTWGIVGYGAIGKQVARVAEALGCKLLVCKRSPSKEVAVTDLDTLCKEADVITLHVPLNAETRGMISAERLARMKETAILVNEARGAVVDEAAVAQAILQGKLGGYGCDVYSVEPFSQDHPYAGLFHLPNVILTPHMAWGSYEARVRCMEIMVSNIQAFCNGILQNRVELQAP